MNNLEKSKDRLKNILVSLEKTIDAKFNRLLLENQMLKDELVKLRIEKTVVKKKAVAKNEIQAEFASEELLNDKKALGEIDLSLRALKKMVE